MIGKMVESSIGSAAAVAWVAVMEGTVGTHPLDRRRTSAGGRDLLVDPDGPVLVADDPATGSQAAPGLFRLTSHAAVPRVDPSSEVEFGDQCVV